MTARAGAALRPLVTTVYVPSVVDGVGQGAAMPMLPLRAVELGASPALAAGIAALLGAGLLLGDLPAGRVVARFGERRAILLGSGAGALGVLVTLLAGSAWVLAAGVLVSGCSMSVWTLARQRYLADAVPVEVRARAMSLFATMWRTGALVGPFVGAAVVATSGLRAAFAVQLVTVALSGWLMSRLPDAPAGTASGEPAPDPADLTVTAIAVRHRRLFATLGMATLFMGAARASCATRSCRCGGPVSGWSPRRSASSSGAPACSRCWSRRRPACSWTGSAGGPSPRRR